MTISHVAANSPVPDPVERSGDGLRVPPADSLVFIGTYNHHHPGGIHAAVFSGQTGELKLIGLAAEAIHPSFLASHPGGRFLYAVSEQPAGLVSAWAIDPKNGALQFLNQASSGGSGPCHISLDRERRIAVIANYDAGNIVALRVLDDGRLGATIARDQWSGAGPRMPRQSKPHPHGTFFSPDGRFLAVPDLGCDRLRIYRMERETAPLELAGTVGVAAGAGPRCFVFHSRNGFGYLLCELDSTIVALRRDSDSGVLEECRTISALPPRFSGENLAAEIAIDTSGRFLYCSNRGADTISVFGICRNGSLDAVQFAPSLGKTPRHFVIDPSGQWMLVANQGSDCVEVFHRDPDSGMIASAGHRIEVTAPTCLVLAPAA